MKKFKASEYIEIDANDLDTLVRETYGINYKCVVSGEWNNDSYHKYKVSKRKLANYEKDDMTYPRLADIDTILTDLCNKDIIEAGNYLITVCW